LNAGGVGDRRLGALSVVDDSSWQALCPTIGRDDWTEWSLSERHDHHDEIDAAIAGWTSTHTAEHIVQVLEDVSIPVSEVILGHLTPALEQLGHRGFFEAIEHPKTGRNTHASMPVRWASLPGPVLAGPAPMLGEHDDLVWVHEVGLSEAEYEGYRESAVIGRVDAKAVAW
jgi:crotonobetainyl-CoA:carnitine CoA-transferase CaiB-like acyl-CoA transferase